jgi:hypothetical protein
MNKNNIRPAPPFPSIGIAVAGLDKPAPFYVAESGFRNMWKEDAEVRATHPRLIAVAKPNGMP